MDNIPTSTKWTLDATGDDGRKAIGFVYMIHSQSTGSKGSGFLLSNGLIVTNEHVIKGSAPDSITAYDALGSGVKVSVLRVDAGRDIALLKPVVDIAGGFELELGCDVKVGEAVYTWGFPLGYNGPNPLLSVGYLAGFSSHPVGSRMKKHLVVNGAFNSGNSGGALFRSSDNKLIGIVVSKHAPISKFHQEAIKVLSENKSGVGFTYTDGSGKEVKYVESQIVSELLTQMRSLTQVMIGEAISIEELSDMLSEKNEPSLLKESRNTLCHCGSGKKIKHCHGAL